MRTHTWILLFTYLLLSACQQESNTEQQEDRGTRLEESPPAEALEEVPEKYISILSNLRIRQEPNQQADIVGKLDYGEAAIYLQEESETKEQIKLRGELKNDTWKKVKITDPVSNEDVIGWVYGGGVVKEAELYKKISDQQFERKIIKASKQELGNILGMNIEDEYFYDGSMSYTKSATGSYVKEGAFEVKGMRPVEISKSYIFELKISISGNYNAGTPDGEFVRTREGYENRDTTVVNFEKGKCQWASFGGSGEGMDYSHREKNPKTCSFSFIEQRYLEVNGF